MLKILHELSLWVMALIVLLFVFWLDVYLGVLVTGIAVALYRLRGDASV